MGPGLRASLTRAGLIGCRPCSCSCPASFLRFSFSVMCSSFLNTDAETEAAAKDTQSVPARSTFHIHRTHAIANIARWKASRLLPRIHVPCNEVLHPPSELEIGTVDVDPDPGSVPHRVAGGMLNVPASKGVLRCDSIRFDSVGGSRWEDRNQRRAYWMDGML